jgi:hypothetical protein
MSQKSIETQIKEKYREVVAVVYIDLNRPHVWIISSGEGSINTPIQTALIAQHSQLHARQFTRLSWFYLRAVPNNNVDVKEGTEFGLQKGTKVLVVNGPPETDIR